MKSRPVFLCWIRWMNNLVPTYSCGAQAICSLHRTSDASTSQHGVAT